MKTVHFNDEVQIKYFSKDKPIVKKSENTRKDNLKAILLFVISILFLFIIVN